MSKALIELVKKRFGAAVLASHSQHGDDTVVLDPKRWVEVHRFLRDDPAAQMDMLVDLCAVDYPDREPRFEVVVHLYSINKKHRLRTKALVGDAEGEGAELDSLTALWGSADWFERETWDMMGVRFANHPDLRRILLYPEFQGHPLRKDYPAQKVQPLVPYREGPDVLDKLAPFGPDEGMSFGRQTHAPDRSSLPPAGHDGTDRSRPRRVRARAALRADEAQHGPCPPGDAWHGAHRARAVGRDHSQGRRAGGLPAPGLREDVRARDVDAVLPLR